MANEAVFSVAGYVATQPLPGSTHSGVPTLTMRLAWTPRRLDAATGNWVDEPSSFASVKCFRKLAENASACLRKGDPVVVTGTMRIREYDARDGSKRTNVDVIATSIGHDLSRGVSGFTKNRPHTEPTGNEYIAAGGTSHIGHGPDRADGVPPADELPPGGELPPGDELPLADDMPDDSDIEEVMSTTAEPAGAPF